MHLSEIWIYPVKSLGGIRVSEAQAEERGLKYDRRWMIVDENGKFLTQRVSAQMTLLDVALQPEGLILSNRLKPDNQVIVPLRPVANHPIEVKVWNDTLTAFTVCDQADAWLSDQLGKKVRIVAMTESSRRKRDPQFSTYGDLVSFADDFPYLLISLASLEELNSRLDEPVEMKRFRPNFVVSGVHAFAEDSWNLIKIGDTRFEMATRCERCIMVNIDPKTGVKNTEPLKTLAAYRKEGKKIFFGRDMTSMENGIVREGDEIVLL